MDKKEQSEFLDVVDEKDSVVGTASMDEIYNKKLTHRIVHVFVIHPETSELYLQRRSLTKSFLPGYYCTSAGGHVRSGETYREAARRELQEELGINPSLKQIDSFVFVSDNHTRLITVFLAKASGNFSFLDKEVMGGVFSSPQKVARLVRKNKKIHPQLRVCFERLAEKATFNILKQHQCV